VTFSLFLEMSTESKWWIGMPKELQKDIEIEEN